MKKFLTICIFVLSVKNFDGYQGKSKIDFFKIARGVANAETGHLPFYKRDRAISPDNAMGIMQILPSTFDDHCKGDIMNRKTNFNCGVKYLKWISKYFCQKDEFCIVMSYRHGWKRYQDRIAKGGKYDRKYWYRYNTRKFS